MTQAYGSIPSSAIVDIPSSIPSGMLYRIKQIQGCNREQVKMVPISGQGSVRGGQKIIVELPPNSLVDLSTFEMIFTGQCDHGGNNSNVINKAVQARYFPRNIASIIDSLDVKINGKSYPRIDQYGYIYNILHDFNCGDDALRKNKIGTNACPDNKVWSLAGRIKRKNLYPFGLVDFPESYGDKAVYTIRQWLGLLGGNGSTSIIHTGMLGNVVIEITLAGGGVLCQSVFPTQISYQNTASITGGFKLNLADNSFGAIGDAYTTTQLIPAQGTNYTLSDISFNITKYSMPDSFYNAMASVLASGQTYQIYFPNYSVYQGIPNNTKQTTTRFSIATRSLDMVIGTFTLPDRDVISHPLVGGNGTTYTIGGATNANGEEGREDINYNRMVEDGFPLLLNTSRYFCRNGEYIKSCRYSIGGTPLNSENMLEMYNGVLRAFNNSQVDMLGGIHPGCASLDHFKTQYFCHILKLSAQTDNDVYTISGVNCAENSIDISWETIGGENVANYDTRLLPNNGACTPVLIACYTSRIDISKNREIVYYT
jgi:hypothetical protein